MEEFPTAAIEAAARSIMTIARFGPLRFSNFYRGLPYWSVGLHAGAFRGKFRNLPAILIGGGPSRAVHADLIRKASGRALIMCADSAYHETARDFGVCADFCATADPQPVNALKLDWRPIRSLIEAGESTIVVGPPTACPEFLGWFKYRAMWSNGPDSDPFSSLAYGLGFPCSSLPANSVNNLLLNFAIFAGCSPIILAGFDFAWPSRASGRHVEGVDGRPVCTSESMRWSAAMVNHALRVSGTAAMNVSQGVQIRQAQNISASEFERLIASLPQLSIGAVSHYRSRREQYGLEQMAAKALDDLRVQTYMLEEMVHLGELFQAPDAVLADDERFTMGFARGCIRGVRERRAGVERGEQIWGDWHSYSVENLLSRCVAWSAPLDVWRALGRTRNLSARGQLEWARLCATDGLVNRSLIALARNQIPISPLARWISGAGPRAILDAASTMLGKCREVEHAAAAG